MSGDDEKSVVLDGKRVAKPTSGTNYVLQSDIKIVHTFFENDLI